VREGVCLRVCCFFVQARLCGVLVEVVVIMKESVGGAGRSFLAKRASRRPLDSAGRPPITRAPLRAPPPLDKKRIAPQGTVGFFKTKDAYYYLTK
jgi:hypothetical protein